MIDKSYLVLERYDWGIALWDITPIFKKKKLKKNL